MYTPSHFAVDDIATLHALINAQPLATLVTHSAAGLNANHIPLHLDTSAGEYGVLRGHIARANRLWQEPVQDLQALAIFQGENTYISPAWYPSKQATGKGVPTWNYVSVHAAGPLRFIDDSAWLRTHLDIMTNRHEASMPAPWRMADAPDDYIDKLLGVIVGLEMPVQRLEGKWKLSQNRPAEDQLGVVTALRTQGQAMSLQMADLMENTVTKK